MLYRYVFPLEKEKALPLRASAQPWLRSLMYEAMCAIQDDASYRTADEVYKLQHLKPYHLSTLVDHTLDAVKPST